jgi:hypothetical protein
MIPEIRPGVKPGFVRWTVVVPIKGEAELTVDLPEGSTKFDAYRAFHNGEGQLLEHEWGYEEDPRSGDSVTVYGPGCEGETVDGDEEGDEEGDDDEEEV